MACRAQGCPATLVQPIEKASPTEERWGCLGVQQDTPFTPGVRRMSYDCARACFSDMKRVTVVPHCGHVPLAMGLPLAVLPTTPFFTILFARHLTQ
jgi:hypothetical protein